MKSVGITGIIFIVFLILKLADLIDWGWIWIFSPIWLSFAVPIVLVILIDLVFSLAEAFRK